MTVRIPRRKRSLDSKRKCEKAPEQRPAEAAIAEALSEIRDDQQERPIARGVEQRWVNLN